MKICWQFSTFAQLLFIPTSLHSALRHLYIRCVCTTLCYRCGEGHGLLWLLGKTSTLGAACSMQQKTTVKRPLYLRLLTLQRWVPRDSARCLLALHCTTVWLVRLTRKVQTLVQSIRCWGTGQSWYPIASFCCYCLSDLYWYQFPLFFSMIHQPEKCDFVVHAYKKKVQSLVVFFVSFYFIRRNLRKRSLRFKVRRIGGVW